MIRAFIIEPPIPVPQDGQDGWKKLIPSTLSFCESNQHPYGVYSWQRFSRGLRTGCSLICSSTLLNWGIPSKTEVLSWQKSFASLDEINFGVEDTKIDVLGNAYEYLIGQFAAAAGKKAGRFYTPSRSCRVAVPSGLSWTNGCQGRSRSHLWLWLSSAAPQKLCKCA